METLVSESPCLAPRIVLDTNVCLDLFVFHDPRWFVLREALHTKKIEAVTRPDCRMEWLTVLNYPQLPLNDTTRIQAAQAFDQSILCIDPAPRTKYPLPLCRDQDDQKFMECARDSQATTLITKDKLLLKLAKKIKLPGLFEIVTPEKYLQQIITFY